MAESIPAKYIRLRNNPATRVHVPTKFLTPVQQKQRARNLANKNLYNPMASLSGDALKNVAYAMADADINPQISAQQSNLDFLNRYSQAYATRLGDVANQFGAGFPQAIQAQQTASQNVINAIANRGTVTQQTIDTNAAAGQASQAADSATRGIGLDAGTTQQLATQFAKQKQDAIQSTADDQVSAAKFNAGFESLINTAAATYPAQAAQAIGAAISPVTKDIADAANELTATKGQRGGLAMKYLTDLRDKQFENQLALKEFGLKSTNSAFENQLAAQTYGLKVAEAAGVNPITGEPLPPDPKDDPTYKSGAFQGLHVSEVDKMTDAQKWRRMKQWYTVTHPAKTDKQHRYVDGAFIGLTPDQVDKLWQTNPKAAQKRVDDYMNRIHPPKTGTKGAGPDWMSAENQGKALQDATKALAGIRKGSFIDPNDPKKTIDVSKFNRKQMGDFLLEQGLNSALVSAVLDTQPKFNHGVRGHLSRETVNKLIAAHIKPSDAAKILGVPTAMEFARMVAKKPVIGMQNPYGATLPNLK